MKPVRFQYACPETLDEALALLAEHGSDAAVLAGGQSLMAMLNLRLAAPSIVITVRCLASVQSSKARKFTAGTTRNPADWSSHSVASFRR